MFSLPLSELILVLGNILFRRVLIGKVSIFVASGKPWIVFLLPFKFPVVMFLQHPIGWFSFEITKVLRLSK